MQTIQEYSVSLTKRIELATAEFVNDIHEQEYDSYIELLNDKSLLMTCDFMLLRQAQKKYPQIFKEVEQEKGINFVNLSESENTDLIINKSERIDVYKLLARKLKNAFEKEYSIKIDLYPYLTGNQMPVKRKQCFQLITGMKMNITEADYFLLVCSQDKLNPKSPYDFIYLFMMDSSEPFDWEKFEDCVRKYECGREKRKNINPINITDGTKLLQVILEDYTGINLPESQKHSISEDELLNFMWGKDPLFTTMKMKHKNSKSGQYRSGISFTRLERLKEFSTYIQLIYSPDSSNNTDTPEISDLMKNIIARKEWDEIVANRVKANRVKEEEAYEEYKKEGNKNKKKKNYGEKESIQRELDMKQMKEMDQTPFNKYCLFFIKEFRKRIRKVYSSDNPECSTSLDITRNDAMFWGYLFISGYLNESCEVREELKEKAKEHYEKEDLSTKKYVASSLLQIMACLDSVITGEEEAYEMIKIVLERFLSLFNFDRKLYYGLLFERYILIACSIEYLEDEYWMTNMLNHAYYASDKYDS